MGMWKSNFTESQIFGIFSGDDGELPLLYGVRVRTYDARYSEEN